MGLFERYESIAKLSDREHGRLIGHVAITYRPPERSTDVFADDLYPLDRITLTAMRRQWQVVRSGRRFPSAPLTFATFQADLRTGQIRLGAATNRAAYDVAMPPHCSRSRRYLRYRDEAGRLIKDRASTVRAAVRLAVVHDAAPERGLQLRATPMLPVFYFGFRSDALPRFEESPALEFALLAYLTEAKSPYARATVRYVREAIEADLRATRPVADPEAVRLLVDSKYHELLTETWNAHLFVRHGLTYVPQAFLWHAPERDYAVHPTSGSVRPLLPVGDEGARAGDWVSLGGRWVPLAQQPADILADIRPCLGAERPNPAYGLLREQGILEDAEGNYERWRLQFTADDQRELEQALAELDETALEALLDELHKRVDLSDLSGYPASRDDLIAALCHPHQPLNCSREARVQLLELTGPPSPETMTFTGPVEVDLFSVRTVMAAEFEPSERMPKPAAVENGARGVASDHRPRRRTVRRRRGRGAGAASTPPADLRELQQDVQVAEAGMSAEEVGETPPALEPILAELVEDVRVEELAGG